MNPETPEYEVWNFGQGRWIGRARRFLYARRGFKTQDFEKARQFLGLPRVHVKRIRPSRSRRWKMRLAALRALCRSEGLSAPETATREKLKAILRETEVRT